MPAITLYACCQFLCHFMLPLHECQFVADTNVGFICGLYWLMSSFWFTTVIHSQVHATNRKKYNVLKSGDRVGQATGPFLPTHLPS